VPSVKASDGMGMRHKYNWDLRLYNLWRMAYFHRKTAEQTADRRHRTLTQKSGYFKVTPWRILYVVAVVAALVLIFRQYGGWNFDEELARYHQKIERLNPGSDELDILAHFSRVQPINKPYKIGVIAVTNHTPVFGGALYRMYDIGYYDMDKRVWNLMHIVCEK
ncbi:uncharacterized protein METZ01_LOCUS330906, partial [marine metagenome]